MKHQIHTHVIYFGESGQILMVYAVGVNFMMKFILRATGVKEGIKIILEKARKFHQHSHCVCLFTV